MVSGMVSGMVAEAVVIMGFGTGCGMEFVAGSVAMVDAVNVAGCVAG